MPALVANGTCPVCIEPLALLEAGGSDESFYWCALCGGAWRSAPTQLDEIHALEDFAPNGLQRGLLLTENGGWSFAVAGGAARGRTQDRVRVFPDMDGVVIALADGAGGVAHGHDAADAVIAAVERRANASFDACALLQDVDDILLQQRSGQTTAVIASVRDGSISGASVGDSAAWLVRVDGLVELTANQKSKPLVGDGCTPIAFEPVLLDSATLLVASDGLFRYVNRERIADIATREDLSAAARALVDAARLTNGSLQDDITVVLCRRSTSS